MKTMTCKLPEQLDAELEAAAIAEGISKSQLVRNVLADQLGRKRGKKMPRAHDLVRDLAGTVKGPADILDNPKYMEDFGA